MRVDPMPTPGAEAPPFEVVDGRGERLSLAGLRGRRVVLVFSRHLGCPICRAHLARLQSRRELFGEDTAVLVFVQSPASSVAGWTAAHAPFFHLVADPEGEVYGRYGVRRGGARALLSPGTLAATVGALAGGHLHGRFEGSELQLPGDFVIDREGRICHAHVGRHLGDATPVGQLAALCG